MHYLQFNNVSFSYDKNKILNNFSFYLNKNEILMIKGKSGIGKSTILKLIAGIEEIQEGEIILDGKNICNEKIENRNIGYLFQEFALFPHLTVTQNIIYSLDYMNKIDKNNRLKELLDLIKLNGYENRYPSQLSGGEKQRVALARSIAKPPKLLLLDEPFSSLNEELKNTLRLELKNILQKIKIPTIIVSHNNEDSIIADRILEIS